MLEQAPNLQPSSAATHPYRVVVIEPRDDLALVLKKLLEHDGHEAHLAGDGLLGVELAASLNPDSILTAIDVPELDGFAIAREIRKRLGTTPLLVATTSYSKAEIGDALRSAGFDIYLAKPVSQESLAAAVRIRNGERPSAEMAL